MAATGREEVTKDVERVAKKQRLCRAKGADLVQRLLGEVQRARRGLAEAGDSAESRAAALLEVQQRAAALAVEAAAVEAAGRELNAVVAKLGKARARCRCCCCCCGGGGSALLTSQRPSRNARAPAHRVLRSTSLSASTLCAGDGPWTRRRYTRCSCSICCAAAMPLRPRR